MTKTNLYPFTVVERDNEDKVEYHGVKTQMHGIQIITTKPIVELLFISEDDTHVGSHEVYEIRVKNHAGQWQDWQAITKDFQILPIIDYHANGNVDKAFKRAKKRFKANFEIRKSGLLWRVNTQRSQIIEVDESIKEDERLIKKINPESLVIDYDLDLLNPCYELEEKIKDIRRFDKKYCVWDEQDNRL